jgi:two-component system cell cycle sensor histidine kinase/response regulator CckA
MDGKALEQADINFFFSMSLDLFCIAGFDGYFKFLNAEWEGVLGYTRAELTSRPYLEFIHPDDRNPTSVVRETLEDGRDILAFENRYVRKDGTPVWIFWRAKSHQDRGLIYAVGRDITERKKVEEEKLRHQSEQFFQLLVENSSDVMSILGIDGKIRYASPALESVLGHPLAVLTGISLFEQIHPDDRAGALQRFVETVGGGAWGPPTDWRVRHRDGSWRTMRTAGRNLLSEPRVQGVVLNSRDVTESLKLEDQVRQSQKMEVVGRLAGGVAHDFNNLLSVINGYAELALEELPAENALSKDLAQILHAGERAASLTKQLLAFSRNQALEMRPIDLNKKLRDADKLLQRLIGEDIQLTLCTCPQLEKVLADPGQIHQVILNLAVNARDAMPRGGSLSFSTENVILDSTYARTHAGVEPGPYVMLTATDTGCGMPKEVMDHIFEPFFTTKAPGKGTGLGLSTVFGIVKQAKGHVWVYSEPGHGTTFKVYLPTWTATAPIVERQPAAPVPTKGSETLLLVEDEDDLRLLTRRLLTNAGYTVLDAKNPETALRVWSEHEKSIDLLLTDVVMPGMSGLELSKKLRIAAPHLKVLYMSGFAGHPTLDNEVINVDSLLLNKPFTRESLLNKLKTILAS